MKKFFTIFTIVALIAALATACSDKKSHRDDDDDDDRTERRERRKADKDRRDEGRKAEAGDIDESALPNLFTPETLPGFDDFDYDLVVMDFNAEWCGPCQMLHPVLVEAAAKYPDVAFISIDVDTHEEYFAATGQQAIPFVVVMNKNGVSTFLGTNDLLPADKFFNIIDGALEGEFQNTHEATETVYAILLDDMIAQM